MYSYILRNNRGAIRALISDKNKSELNVVGGYKVNDVYADSTARHHKVYA